MKKVILPIMVFVILIGIILAWNQAYNNLKLKYEALEKEIKEANASQNVFLQDRDMYMFWMQDIKEIKEMLKHQNDFIITTINKTIDDRFQEWFNCYKP